MNRKSSTVFFFINFSRLDEFKENVESDFKKDTKLENLFFLLTVHHFLF